MTESINAWRIDSKGYFIEMQAGERKDYDLDWTDVLEGRALAEVVWTIADGVTKVLAEANQAITKVWLQAGDGAGSFTASARITSDGSPSLVVVFRFRVVVRA